MKTIDSLLADAKKRELQAAKDREVLETLRKLDPEALQRAMGLLNGGNLPSNVARPGIKERIAPVSVPTTSAAVREAVMHMPSNFTASNVRQYIDLAYPSLHVNAKANAVSSILSTMAKGGKIGKLPSAPGAPSTFKRNGG